MNIEDLKNDVLVIEDDDLDDLDMLIAGYMERDMVAMCAKKCTFVCVHDKNARCNPEKDCKSCGKHTWKQEHMGYLHENLNGMVFVA